MKYDIKKFKGDIIPYICALAIMGFFLVMGLTVAVNATFRKANVIYRVSEKNEFCSEVAQNADEAMSGVEEPDALLEGISANLATAQQVKTDFKAYADNANSYLHSSNYNLENEVKSDAIEKLLRDRIKKCLAEKGETAQTISAAAIDEYITAVGDAYSNEVSLLKPLKASIIRTRSVIANTTRNIAFCLVCAIAICIVIYRLTWSRRYTLRWIGCGITAAGVSLLTVPAFFNTSIASAEYTLSKNALLVANSVGRGFCTMVVISGIVITLIGAAVLLTGIFIKKRSRRHRV